MLNLRIAGNMFIDMERKRRKGRGVKRMYFLFCFPFSSKLNSNLSFQSSSYQEFVYLNSFFLWAIKMKVHFFIALVHENFAEFLGTPFLHLKLLFITILLSVINLWDKYQ